MSNDLSNRMTLKWPLAFVAATSMLVAGCGGDDKQSRPSPTPTASKATPSAPPVYSAEQVRAALISPKEIGAKMRQIDIGLDSLQRKQAPMCSLTGTRLPGRYGAAVRQFSNPVSGKGEIKYAQLIARYPDAQGAAAAYEVLRKAARSCPPKRHVPPKRLNENFTLFEHDDTWKVTEADLVGWAHLRGLEQHVEPPSQTKFNVYYFIYDYAHRGNVVTTTLYWERTEPKKSGDPIAQRATELLTRQLQKIG